MKKLYSMHFDCGRMGDLEGVFMADSDELEAIIGKEIYFGEVLGKHSEIFGPLEDGDITMISDDRAVIEVLEGVFNTNTISGYNPLDYYEED